MRAPFVARPQFVRKTGAVQSFIMGHGRVRAVVLTDGSRVWLRRPSRRLLRSVRLGSIVRVRGYVIPTGDRRMVRFATVTAVRSRRDMRNASYSPPPVPVPAPGMSPAPFAGRGTVQTVVRSPNGFTQSLILSDGTSVRLPDSMARALSGRGVQAGESVMISGRVIGFNPRALVAETLTFSDGTSFQSGSR